MSAGAMMRDPVIAYQKLKGFRNNYSATAQEEDRAEVTEIYITLQFIIQFFFLSKIQGMGWIDFNKRFWKE